MFSINVTSNIAYNGGITLGSLGFLPSLWSPSLKALNQTIPINTRLVIPSTQLLTCTSLFTTTHNKGQDGLPLTNTIIVLPIPTTSTNTYKSCKRQNWQTVAHQAYLAGALAILTSGSSVHFLRSRWNYD